jgi:hypothetical protein
MIFFPIYKLYIIIFADFQDPHANHHSQQKKPQQIETQWYGFQSVAWSCIVGSYNISFSNKLLGFGCTPFMFELFAVTSSHVRCSSTPPLSSTRIVSSYVAMMHNAHCTLETQVQWTTNYNKYSTAFNKTPTYNKMTTKNLKLQIDFMFIKPKHVIKKCTLNFHDM